MHTLLIGTSKTVKGSEYFCKGNNVSRFWGTLKMKNNKFQGNKPETGRLHEMGICVTDISSAKAGDEKADKKIKSKSLKEGFKNLEDKLENESDLKRIGFIGKQAAKWFFIYFIDSIDLNNDESKAFKTEMFRDYGKQDWQLSIKKRKIDCYILTNIHRYWNNRVWGNFWSEVFNPSNN